MIIKLNVYGMHPRGSRMVCMAVSDLFIEYDLSIVDVPVLPVASGGISIICSQAAVRLCIRSVL
jgi:hypothetical protein